MLVLAKYCLRKSLFHSRYSVSPRRVDYRLYKVYPNSTSKCSISHRIRNVAPVVGKSSSDIVIHAPSRTEDSVTSPATLMIKGVRVGVLGSHSGDIAGL